MSLADEVKHEMEGLTDYFVLANACGQRVRIAEGCLADSTMVLLKLLEISWNRRDNGKSVFTERTNLLKSW